MLIKNLIIRIKQERGDKMRNFFLLTKIILVFFCAPLFSVILLSSIVYQSNEFTCSSILFFLISITLYKKLKTYRKINNE